MIFILPIAFGLGMAVATFAPSVDSHCEIPSTFSMGVDFADIDRDGRDDIFVSDMLDARRERRMMQFSAIEASPSALGVFDDRPAV
jgi:hypothetical protein